MKKIIKNNLIKNFLIFLAFFTCLEIIFRLVSNINIFDLAMIRIFIGLNIISILLSFLISPFREKGQSIAILIIAFINTIYAYLQLGFNDFVGVYASFNQTSQLGAVTDYIKDFFRSFNLIYYLILIPFIVLVILYIHRFRKVIIDKTINYKPLKRIIITVIALAISGGIYYATIVVSWMQPVLQLVSNKELFRYPSVPSIVVNQYGVIGFGVLDVKSLIIKDSNGFIYEEPKDEPENEVIKNREFDDTDWQTLIDTEKNIKLNNINKYLINQNIPDYNEYTGVFKDKNLIVIMMESVGEIFINEDLYPNFYKIYSEGWSFVNNYSPRNSCATGNNEFSGATGLYTIQNNCTANVYRKNTYFEAIFNLFNNAGYKTSSMHNYTEAYYYRRTIHPNLGSSIYYGVEDLGIDYDVKYDNWSSDEDFMKVAMDITLADTSKPFMLWLTTVSSHQPYSVKSIEGDKYLDITADTNYPTDLRRYMSKLKTLDNGLGVLLDRLENAGILDDTVIVLYGDHYPYGLKNETINYVLDYDLSEYEVERTPLVIYNHASESQVIDKYTSYINITPTVANLFALDYDPRLYMGMDLFDSNYLNIVTFADGSWKNNLAYYDAGKSKIKYYTDEIMATEDIVNINNTVKNKLQISKSIIESNYFAYLDKNLNKIKEERLNTLEIEDMEER